MVKIIILFMRVCEESYIYIHTYIHIYIYNIYLYIYIYIYVCVCACACEWRVILQKPINATFKKNDCRALFSTYSAIWMINTFSKKSWYYPLSSHREFRFYCRSHKCPCCFWTEADKTILANQRAVFRSGDKATFTLKRRASWEEFRQSWLKVIEDQSRSSLYAEYAGCIGPPKHQGAPLPSNMF